MLLGSDSFKDREREGYWDVFLSVLEVGGQGRGVAEVKNAGRNVKILTAALDVSQSWSASSVSWNRERRSEEELTEDVESKDKSERNHGDLSDGDDH